MQSLRAMKLTGLAFLVLMVSAGFAMAAPTVVKSGFNIFSEQQDVEIGQQSALQVEKQLPMLNDAAALRYVSAIGARLAAQAPGPKFTYRFKVANLSDLNAFALPGGFLYVHRGLLDQVRTEGELAGVLAHEIAHVALRHPTNQASKAYLAQAGLGVLGGLLGGKSASSTGQIVGAVGGFGMNALFLKFSRSLETQADIVGAQIMARAGYDPVEMAHFFSYMAQQSGGNPGSVARFLSDHPSPANRETRVRQEAALVGSVRRIAPIGSLVAVQTNLRRLAPAPTSAQFAAGLSPSGAAGTTASTTLSIERPSTRYVLYRRADRSFQIEQPENWTAAATSSGLGVSFVPRGGLVAGPRGQDQLAYGVIVNHYVPLDGYAGVHFAEPESSPLGNSALDDATGDLIRQIQTANPHLDYVEGSDRRTTTSGRPSLTLGLAGLSPATGRSERASLVTRLLADGHIIYMLAIAPGNDYAALAPTFDRMMRSLQVNESVAHQ